LGSGTPPTPSRLKVHILRCVLVCHTGSLWRGMVPVMQAMMVLMRARNQVWTSHTSSGPLSAFAILSWRSGVQELDLLHDECCLFNSYN